LNCYPFLTAMLAAIIVIINVMSLKIFEKVQKKLGEQDVLLAPPIILLGKHLLPLLPLFPRL